MKDFKLFLDCGAPSFYEKLSKKRKTKVMGARFADRKFNDYSYVETPEYIDYFQKYISYLKEYKVELTTYSNLDVISNPKLTLRNQQEMERQGLEPIPVYHLGTNEKYLKRYVEKYPYIAIGGLVPNPTRVLIPVLDRIWKEYLLDSDGFPKVKVHGFACTSLPLMARYPWYSVDSATSQKLAMYGKILQPVIGKDDWRPISVSTRDIPIADRVTPLVMQAIHKTAQNYGLTLTELGDSIDVRFRYNHLVMLELVAQLVPMWPWSFFDRSSKGTSFFLLYAAGIVQSWEALLLAAEVAGLGDSMCRLDSFFYKSRANKSITLRKDIRNGDK
jgi:uncharacterized protein YozE (UPF0346 family)